MHENTPPLGDVSTTGATGHAPAQGAARSRVRRWVARFGVLGILFFFIKGLAWLIVPALVVALR